MKKTKVFIAGKITKASLEIAKQRFDTVAAELKEKGLQPVLPTVYSESMATWHDSIRSDISALMACEELHLLNNWQGHRRSEILRDVALRIGMNIHYH